MKNNTHFFSRNEYIKNEDTTAKLGLRGREANDFAAIDLPILPGFILDSEVAAHLEDVDLKPILKQNMKKAEKVTNKVFGDPENPMLVKIVVSPNLAIVHYPTLHNYGLTEETIPGFKKFVGDNFGFHEIQFLLKGNLEVEARIAELEKRPKDMEVINKQIENLTKEMKKGVTIKDREKSLVPYLALLPEGFLSDGYVQLELALKRISRMLSFDEMNDDDAALLIQPMVHGNYGEDSASGYFYTRNIVSGEKRLQGEYFENKFDSVGGEGNDINKIGKGFHTELVKVAGKVEDHFKEIRTIRFTIENGKVWLIDQRPMMTKSTQADIQTLLDLNKRKIIDDEYLIGALKPEQLNEILHPVVNMSSVKPFKKLEGGISGAPGAAIGRLYFNTERLIEARKESLQLGEDPRFILCMEATFAEDVKAIEVATGVLSSEGGYAAHASVVARQYGKVSLVVPEMKIRGKKATIGNVTLNEGDMITLNVPNYGDPQIFLGQAELIEPDPETSGLLDFIDIVKKNVHKDFHVRANADTPKDAALALKFGAEGIGLCRTEHMFFLEDRINVFREMILSDTSQKRSAALKKLGKMQKDDFYKIFKVMKGREVTIRLLDAPLHEFLPHNKDEMDSFLAYMKKANKGKPISKAAVQGTMDSLREFNPMLGHRGCRIAISFPEIYDMQMRAIFEAVYALKKEKITVYPEIMVPLIMNENELKMIVYGKKIEGRSYRGLVDIEKEVRSKLGSQAVPYKIGTMIELPVAALGAGEIAKYAEFFSFGTNDLTQTTIGLSRDDYNSFMPDYTQFDIIDGNPFQKLDSHVKELIATAVLRGTMTRPDLKKGLCGEHGAVPGNIKFCMDSGLDYVSCSSYSVPIANLAVAQFNFEKNASEG
ncbi:MAG: putative PEP-binding protein [Spirochaetia bacterium]